MILQAFYQIAFCKKTCQILAKLWADLEEWIRTHNEERPNSDKYCDGKKPIQTFLDSIPLAKAKMLDSNLLTVA